LICWLPEGPQFVGMGKQLVPLLEKSATGNRPNPKTDTALQAERPACPIREYVRIAGFHGCVNAQQAEEASRPWRLFELFTWA